MTSTSVASTSSQPMSPPLFSSDFESDLFDVLLETNLLQYYHNFASDFKISSMHDLKNLTDSELDSVGLNSVEIRRLRRVVKKDSGPRSFFRLKKKFSFRAPRVNFEVRGGERSTCRSRLSQDDSSSIFRGTGSKLSRLRNSARHLSLTRCGPAPPLVALLDPDLVVLIPTKILGEGEFATVYQGVLKKDTVSQDKDGMVGCMGLSASVAPSSNYKTLASEFAEFKMPGGKSSKLLTIAIKRFAPNCLGRPLHVFLQHIALLSDLRHANLLHMFGCYTDEYCQPALVCELASLRSLIDVFSDSELRLIVTPMHLCRFAEQIASAMSYLEKRHVVHGDLACRNIMLSSLSMNAQIKVADYGLLKALGVLVGNAVSLSNSANTPPSTDSVNNDDTNSTSTTDQSSKLRLPVAWCAPETLRSIEMTSSSDVWSFGVTLWEMFSYGEQPWCQLSAGEILDAVDEPNCQRLAQPQYCPRDYYDDVMLPCWRHDASERPSFAYLEQHLPLVRPDQVQTVKPSTLLVDERIESYPLIHYSAGEVITVLDKRTGNEKLWKGVTSDGCLGYFDATDVVYYTDLLVPSSGGETATLCIAPTPPLQNNVTTVSGRPVIKHPTETQKAQQPQGFFVISPPPIDQDCSIQFETSSNKLTDTSSEKSNSLKRSEMPKTRSAHVAHSISSKTIDSSMISLPRGDLRHVGHIGYDGAVSGQVDFIAPGVERVCIESLSNQGTLPRSEDGNLGSAGSTGNLKRVDSFEEGFQLPNLSIETEVQEMISNIRLSDFLSTETSRPESKQGEDVDESTKIEMRQPRQPTLFKESPNLQISTFEHQMTSPVSRTSTTSDVNISPISSGDSDLLTQPEISATVLTAKTSDDSIRFMDSPPMSDETEPSSPAPKSQNKPKPPAVTQRRVSFVTSEERQQVYDEVREKCGHPLLMGDCLRAVSYTQGNVDAAVKFLKLQYLASHRVAEVEKCKNALVACDWEVDRALEMLRMRSSEQHTSFTSGNSSFLSQNSDAVNV